MKRLLLILLLAAVSSVMTAQGKSEDRKAKLEKEIAFLDRQINENSKKSKSALNTLNLTKQKISTRKKLIAENERDIRELNDRIASKQEEINQLSDRIDTLLFYYRKLVLNAYKNRDARVWYMYILASDNLNQAARRFTYLRGLSSQMKIQARKLQDTKAELETQRKQMEDLKSSALSLKKVHSTALSQLNREEQDSERLVNELKRNRAKYQKELNAKKQQKAALDKELKKVLEKKSGKPVDVKLSGAFAANKGKLPWPVKGVITESFGEHYHPVYKSVKLPFNNGVGIATSPNESVKAVFDGEVRQVIIMPGYNKCVLIQHGDYFTFYCKLGSVNVKAGDKIKLGQRIGQVDSGENQLHFQIWKDKVALDPSLWLR